jgi:hypothetical protein
LSFSSLNHRCSLASSPLLKPTQQKLSEQS